MLWEFRTLSVLFRLRRPCTELPMHQTWKLWIARTWHRRWVLEDSCSKPEIATILLQVRKFSKLSLPTLKTKCKLGERLTCLLFACFLVLTQQNSRWVTTPGQLRLGPLSSGRCMAEAGVTKAPFHNLGERLSGAQKMKACQKWLCTSHYQLLSTLEHTQHSRKQSKKPVGNGQSKLMFSTWARQEGDVSRPKDPNTSSNPEQKNNNLHLKSLPSTKFWMRISINSSSSQPTNLWTNVDDMVSKTHIL